MAELSSQKTSSPKMTPKEEHVTLDKPKSPNPFLPASRVDFTFDEITFITNNEVALLETMFATIGYKGRLGQKKLSKSVAFLLGGLLMAQIMHCLGGKTDGVDQISNKDATVLYCLANGVQVDYAKIIWEDLIHKLNKKIKEKIVLDPRFLSLLLEHMLPEYENEELTINLTQMCLWTPNPQNLPHKLRRSPKAKSLELRVDSKENDLQNTHLSSPLRHQNPKLANQKRKQCPVQPISPSHPSPPTPMVGEMHRVTQQAVGGPTSLGATSEEGAHPQLSSDSTAKADPGISALKDSISKKQDMDEGTKTTHLITYFQGANEESRADDISLKVKLEDLLDILKDTRSDFFTLDSPPDEPIIISNESEEEEKVAKDKDIEATSHDVHKDTSVPPYPSLKSA
nr:hypothetical protein [Tanacetum cinerariifolium]